MTLEEEIAAHIASLNTTMNETINKTTEEVEKLGTVKMSPDCPQSANRWLNYSSAAVCTFKNAFKFSLFTLYAILMVLLLVFLVYAFGGRGFLAWIALIGAAYALTMVKG